MSAEDTTKTAPEKPRTQRELSELMLARLDELREAQQRYAAVKASAGSPPRYTEADALRRCIDALQDLQHADERTRIGSGAFAATSSNFRGGWAPGDRILRFLADRFGVNLIETREQPCARRHLDEISPDQVFAALNGANAGQRVNW